MAKSCTAASVQFLKSTVCKHVSVQLSLACIAQQHVMIATIAVLAAVAFAMAIWQRHQGQMQHLTQTQNFSLNLLRAVSSAVAFTALALFTTPAPTCLFPDYSRPGGTKIPPWLQSYVLAILAAGLSALSAAVPGFVTDPPPPDHLPLASGPAATGTTRGTA